MKKMMKRWWVYQNTSKYDRRMTSMDEVMMRMSASVMATPVRPAMVVNMTTVGFCNHSHLQLSVQISLWLEASLYLTFIGQLPPSTPQLLS